MFYRCNDSMSINIDNINQIVIKSKQQQMDNKTEVEIDANSLDAYTNDDIMTEEFQLDKFQKYYIAFEMTNHQEIILDQEYSYAGAKDKLYNLIIYFNGLQNKSTKKG